MRGHAQLPDEVPCLIAFVLMMLLILLLAAAVVLYVAYPHRGETVPAAPWLGKALQRGAEHLPHIDMDAARCPVVRGCDQRSGWIGPWISWVNGSI